MRLVSVRQEDKRDRH
ncbi:unnamed protein product [Victoria cruziana]